jgi:hypothetical protein
MRNLAECTKIGGYFIGTCYDGKLVYNMLKGKSIGESVQIYDEESETKIWEIRKEYDYDTFEDDVSSVGYKIDVYQESINKMIPEYLVNFDYLNRLMINYGFELLEREEAQNIGLPEGSGLFSELFNDMLEEIKRVKFKKKEYGEAPNMNANERKISFLNRYFVYKKLHTVNAEKVVNELLEETFVERAIQTKREVASDKFRKYKKEESVEKEEDENEAVAKSKPVKLKKKLVLVEATEAVAESEPPIVLAPKPKKPRAEKVKKLKFRIEE